MKPTSSHFNFHLLVLAVILGSCYHIDALPPQFPSQAGLKGSSNATDLLALLSFKSLITDDPSDALASWNESFHFCQWHGVSCGGRWHPDRVTALDIDSLGLAGLLSPSLANLTFIRRINLPNNKFHGPIPKDLGLLFRLQYLNLSMNSFAGSIPRSLSQLTNLRNISFRSNKLDGEIPYDLLYNQSGLLYLDFSSNKLTGSISPSLGNISTLVYLDLSNNSLTGELPSSIGKLHSLTYFDVARNFLSGDIPQSLWNFSSLTHFTVHTNNLSGSIPSDMGNTLPYLQKLLIYENQLSGSIPLSIANASRLQHIELYYNEFSGTIPSNLGTLLNLQVLILGNNQLEAREENDWLFFPGLTNCTNLQKLELSNNMLVGTLPGSITNLSMKLDWFGMRGNQISGSIPPGIGNLVSLTAFFMQGNLLTGEIPDTIGQLQGLNVLHLSGNKFSGKIPQTIGNLTNLNLLYLEDNELSGEVPSILRNCQNLNLLNLGFNRLTGTIPKEVFSITSLSIYLSFANNLLTGSLPSEVGRLQSLDALDVSNNQLDGEIPSTLGECQALEYLFMEGNFFHGIIPSSFKDLKGLLLLDLSRNNISGQIPAFLGEIHDLNNLNLSFNNFEGEVPSNGIFKNASVISILGNDKLCGNSPVFHLPSCTIETPRKKHSSTPRIIVLVGGSVIGSILLICLLAAILWSQKSRWKFLHATHTKDYHMSVSYSELAKATGGFSTANLIGTGSYGSVYKAVMVRDNDKIVAVKVLNLQQKGASRSFIAECETLRNVRHRNLVKILTVCSSVDFKGNDFKALIFEFMTNGSLEDWLHPKIDAPHEAWNRSLSLIQRLNIAIDVASALDYLHCHGQTPIVHCDLKSSNVLLDEDMIAHVGDFGLARFLNKTASKSSQNATSSSGLKGTIGYVAPEYGMANKVSTHGDVYSYGILLLEMFTGKRPTDDAFIEGLNLPKYVEMAFTGRIMEIVDLGMFLEGSGEISSAYQSSKQGKIEKCLVSVLRVGLSCTQELPANRMQMGDVVNEIRTIRDVFLRGEFGSRGEEKLH